MIVEDHSLKSHMPYSTPSREFAARVAALGAEGAYDDAVETLDALIAKARQLCGCGPPAA